MADHHHPTITQLQLLIARAAQVDSLAWWDDNALSDPGAFLLQRVFPYAPHAAAKKLAIKAASARHAALFGDQPQVVHLFNIQDEDNPFDRREQIVDFELGELARPITSLQELRQHLTQISDPPAWASYGSPHANRSLEIAVRKEAPSEIEYALGLAWGYLEGNPSQPVFPYLTK